MLDTAELRTKPQRTAFNYHQQTRAMPSKTSDPHHQQAKIPSIAIDLSSSTTRVVQDSTLKLVNLTIPVEHNHV